MKVLAKLFSLLCVIALCFSFACCGGNNSSSSESSSEQTSTSDSSTDSSATAPATAYTVYVTDANGNPIEGVRIGICSYNLETHTKGSCEQPIATDANGKVVFNNPEAVYIINNEIFIDEYTAQEDCVLTAYGEYTLVLTAI